MEAQEYTYDPFQLQNVPAPQRFSFQEKVIAVVLASIFMMIPLYELSSDAFKVNYVHELKPSTSCAMYLLEMYPKTPTQFTQGKKN